MQVVVESTCTCPHCGCPEMVTPEAVAEMLCVDVVTLTSWQVWKVGPPYVKVGSRHRAPVVRYRLSDVNAWLQQHEYAAGRCFSALHQRIDGRFGPAPTANPNQYRENAK